MDGGASGSNKISVTAITSSAVAVSAPHPPQTSLWGWGSLCSEGGGSDSTLDPVTLPPLCLSLSLTTPLRPLILTHCRERLMVRVEFLGAVHAPLWPQPRPHPPAPLHGPAPQLLVSGGAKRAQEGVMISICGQ